MNPIELELGQLVKRWRDDTENILRALDGLTDDYDTGYAHGIRQASDELNGFLWERFCRELDDRIVEKNKQADRRRDGG